MRMGLRNICAEYRFGYYGAWSGRVRAWAIAESGGLDEGLAAYDIALEEFRRTSAGLRISHHLGLLAALHRKTGKSEAGFFRSLPTRSLSRTQIR